MLKKAASGEEIGVRYAGKFFVLQPIDEEDTSYAQKEHGVTKVELKRFAKRMNPETKKAIKTGKCREYHGDIEAILKD